MNETDLVCDLRGECQIARKASSLNSQASGRSVIIRHPTPDRDGGRFAGFWSLEVIWRMEVEAWSFGYAV
jgi:hypothetical protein